LLPNGILPGAKFTLRPPSLALSFTAQQSSSGREPNFAALKTGRHLYSAGRPSGWALAHILVKVLRPTRHKIGHFGDVPDPKPISWLGMEKTKPNTAKACIHQSKEMHYNMKQTQTRMWANVWKYGRHPTGDR